MVRRFPRPLLAVAAVLLIAGFSSRCEPIHSDVRLLDDTTRVDLPGLDGTFVDEAGARFDIVRQGQGLYVYVGPTIRVPDHARIPEATIREMRTTFERLQAEFDAAVETLETVEHADEAAARDEPAPAGSPPNTTAMATWQEALWRDLRAGCPWLAPRQRRCARIFARHLEALAPGFLAFERSLGGLPTKPVRHRLLFSLHAIGDARFVVQAETILERRSPHPRSEEIAYFLAFDLELIDLAYRLFNPFDFLGYEAAMTPRSIHYLVHLGGDRFAIPKDQACTSDDDLAAYGFKARKKDSGWWLDPLPATSVNPIGLLNACFPPPETSIHRFWRIDAAWPDGDPEGDDMAASPP